MHEALTPEWKRSREGFLIREGKMRRDCKSCHAWREKSLRQPTPSGAKIRSLCLSRVENEVQVLAVFPGMAFMPWLWHTETNVWIVTGKHSVTPGAAGVVRKGSVMSLSRDATRGRRSTLVRVLLSIATGTAGRNRLSLRKPSTICRLSAFGTAAVSKWQYCHRFLY